MYLKRGKPNFMAVPKGRKTRLFFRKLLLLLLFYLFGNVWSLYAMLGYINRFCNVHLIFNFFFTVMVSFSLYCYGLQGHTSFFTFTLL